MKTEDCETSEIELIRKIRKGDIEAFKQMYLKYHPILIEFIFVHLHCNATSEELVQNIFLNVWEKRNFLRTDGNLKAYLYQCARNAIKNHLRYQKIRDHYAIEQDMVQEYSWTPESELLYIELKENFENAIDELPTKRRIIFLYAFQDGLPRKKIAEKMGISIKTVEDHLWKALKHIRQSISEYMLI